MCVHLLPFVLDGIRVCRVSVNVLICTSSCQPTTHNLVLNLRAMTGDRRDLASGNPSAAGMPHQCPSHHGRRCHDDGQRADQRSMKRGRAHFGQYHLHLGHLEDAEQPMSGKFAVLVVHLATDRL